MDRETPSRRVLWGFIDELAPYLFGALLIGIGHFALHLFEDEWQLPDYLILGGLFLLGASAVMLYRRSRQVLP